MFYLVETYRTNSCLLQFSRSDDHLAIFFSRHAAEDFCEAIGSTSFNAIVPAMPLELLRRLQVAAEAGIASFSIAPDTPVSCFHTLETSLLKDPYAVFQTACSALADVFDSTVSAVAERGNTARTIS